MVLAPYRSAIGRSSAPVRESPTAATSPDSVDAMRASERVTAARRRTLPASSGDAGSTAEALGPRGVPVASC